MYLILSIIQLNRKGGRACLANTDLNLRLLQSKRVSSTHQGE